MRWICARACPRGESRRMSSVSSEWCHCTPPEKPSLPPFTDNLPRSSKSGDDELDLSAADSLTIVLTVSFLGARAEQLATSGSTPAKSPKQIKRRQAKKTRVGSRKQLRIADQICDATAESVIRKSATS